MKNGMKKIVTFIIAAAMLSASVYAENETVEVATAVAYTVDPSEEQVYPEEPVPPEDIAFEEPVGNDIASEDPIDDEPFDADYGEDEDGLREEPFPELGSIDDYLEKNGYPDYLSFICNVAGAINGYDPTSEEEYQPKITYWWDVGVVNATPEQKAEIQALVDRLYPIENELTFIDCTYSYAERKALIPEILETVKKLFPELPVKDVSLIRNTEQIGVTIDTAVIDEEPIEVEMLREKLYAIYGDIVFVSEYAVTTDDVYDDEFYDGAGLPTVGIAEATFPETDEAVEMIEAAEEEGVDFDANDDTIYGYGGAVTTSEETGAPAAPVGGDVDSAPTAGEIAAIAPPTEQSGDSTVMWICIVAGLVIALGTVAFIYRAKLIPVFATSGGNVTLNKKQAEEAVKNSEVIPDDSVLQAIKEKIDK